MTVTYDPRLPEPYAIAIARPLPWPASPAFGIRFEGARTLAIGTDRHRLSDGGGSLTVTDTGFGKVLDGLEYNATATATADGVSATPDPAGFADPVQAFRACADGGIARRVPTKGRSAAARAQLESGRMARGVARRIEAGAVGNTAIASALDMESFISPPGQDLAEAGGLSPPARQVLHGIFPGTSPGERVMAAAMPELPFAARLSLCRFLQEALSNAHRHAGGSQVEVAIVTVAGGIEASVADRGPGFDPQAAATLCPDGGQGLISPGRRAGPDRPARPSRDAGQPCPHRHGARGGHPHHPGSSHVRLSRFLRERMTRRRSRHWGSLKCAARMAGGRAFRRR